VCITQYFGCIVQALYFVVFLVMLHAVLKIWFAEAVNI